VEDVSAKKKQEEYIERGRKGGIERKEKELGGGKWGKWGGKEQSRAR
jgi:hypothetical protein